MASKKSKRKIDKPLIGFTEYDLDELVSDWGFPRAVDACIGKTVRISLENSPGEIFFSTVTAVSVRKGELRIAIQEIPSEDVTLFELEYKSERPSPWYVTTKDRETEGSQWCYPATCAVISS